jgi:signal transduction histidine kinase
MFGREVKTGDSAIRALDRLQYHSDTFTRLAQVNVTDAAKLVMPAMRSVLECRSTVVVCRSCWRTATADEHAANFGALPHWDILASHGVAECPASPVPTALGATLAAFSREQHAAGFTDKAYEQELVAHFGVEGPWLCVPMRCAVGHQEEVFAFCLVANRRRGTFGDIDCTVADILTAVLAGALINARTNEDLIATSTADRAKSEFLANMSHEIRTPMTAILGFAEVVLENVSDPQNVNGLKTIQRNGEYLLKIINDILDLSKIEAGKLVSEQIECSPGQVLADVASLMRVRASAAGLTLEVEYDGPMPEHIQSDPTRLRQILINLIGNAIKFTEVGKVRVLVRLLDVDSDRPQMQFDVIDTGIGLTAEQIDKLFETFVQADASTTRKFGGTGLGLTISKRLAEMLGGSIQVRSTPGEGSTFSLAILTGPLAGVTMVDKMTGSEASIGQVANPAIADAPLECRILLAEDGPDNQRLISFFLKKAGADVTVAENGRIALELALAAHDEGTPSDVILMDMQMPVLDGYSATAELRDAGYRGPVIALTAHAMSGDKDKCIIAGCDDYATKLIDRKKLIAMVAQYACHQEHHNASEAPIT